MTILPITLTIAGAAALLNLWIAIRVGILRTRHKIMISDGGNDALAARMRAHSNFTEYTPIFLILLGLIELAQGPALWLWVVAIIFILARILHVFGMDRAAPNALRGAGAGLTMLGLLVLAVYAIWITYGEERRNPMTYAAQEPAVSVANTD